jgi:hypothetical protein
MGILGDIFGVGGDGGASDYQKQALAEFDKLQIPDPEKMKVELEKLVQQGTITPEQARTYLIKKSAFSDIKTDPSYVAAQKKSLAGIQEIADQGGLTSIDRARISDIQDAESAAERGSRQAILQNAQERGVGGSGLELAAQLENQQGSATRRAKQDTDVAAEAMRRSLEALIQGGQLGGQLETQAFGEEEAKAAAADAIAKFNASQQSATELQNVAARNAAQEANLREKQRIADTNVATTNTQRTNNAQVYQNAFDNAYKKAAGKAGVYTNMADTAARTAASNDAFTGSLLGVAGNIGSAMITGNATTATAKAAAEAAAKKKALEALA